MTRVNVDYENGEKICPGCGCVKSLDCFGKHTRDGFRSRCKSCDRLARKTGAWSCGKEASKKAASKRHYEKYKEKNKEKNCRLSKEWIANNRDRYRQVVNRLSSSLSDGYVRNRLTERCLLLARDIPQWMVDLERERLRIVRLIKEIENEKC